MGCKNGKPVLRPEDKEALAKTSGLSEDEVESKFEAFLKDHPDGKLRKKDFREMMSQVRNTIDINQLKSNSILSGSSKERLFKVGEACIPHL